jgi:hypothetical protein
MTTIHTTTTISTEYWRPMYGRGAGEERITEFRTSSDALVGKVRGSYHPPSVLSQIWLETTQIAETPTDVQNLKWRTVFDSRILYFSCVLFCSLLDMYLVRRKFWTPNMVTMVTGCYSLWKRTGGLYCQKENTVKSQKQDKEYTESVS